MPPQTDATDLAERLRAQLLSNVERTQALSLDVARTWVKACSALPGADRKGFRPAGTGRGTEAAAIYSLDLACDLLAAHRSYVRRMMDLLDPTTSA